MANKNIKIHVLADRSRKLYRLLQSDRYTPEQKVRIENIRLTLVHRIVRWFLNCDNIYKEMPLEDKQQAVGLPDRIYPEIHNTYK